MDTHISPRAISKLTTRLLGLKHHHGVPTNQISSDTSVADIREILGNYDPTGRLAAQIRQAFLQGVL